MDQQEYITTSLRTILDLLGIVTTEIVREEDEKTGTLRFVVKTPDSALLIGEHGARLLALNHLVKRMTEKQYPGSTLSFLIDVNDYQKKHIEDVRAKAHMLAERARYFKSSVEMDPMSSYERMIVHAEFSEVIDIVTESSGQGKERHIVIRFTEEKIIS